MSHRARGGGEGGGERGRRRRRRRAAPTEVEEDAAIPEMVIVRPSDAIRGLTEKQLGDDVPRVLTANDPNVATGLVCFSFSDGSFKPLPTSAESEHVATHLSMEGSLVAKESDSGVAQLGAERLIRSKIQNRRRELEKRAREESKPVEELEEEFGDAGGRNQFNYSERAAQTYTASTKTRTVTTVPPETSVYGSTVTQWDVYDSYMAEYERLVAAEEEEEARTKRGSKASSSSSGSGSGTKVRKERSGEAVVHGPECGLSLKIIERMVTQNAEDEFFSDLRYWEDESDKYRPGGMGTLLPLWRFVDSARVRRKMVTAVACNPRYGDLFAVGYGSYDFMRQTSGLISVFSLKNVSTPEFSFSLESGVMCLDWHPENPALIAVGCYDGTVRVFDVRRRENRPVYSADVRSGKHTDPVWSVLWQPDDSGADYTFFSVSSDGRVGSWILSKNELQMETIMTLKLVASGDGGGEGGAEEGGEAGGGGGEGDGTTVAEDEGSLAGLAGGCCLDFNSFSEHLYVVGTEEGRLHKCSKSFGGQYLLTYEGHHMAVYAVRWSPFHERVFLSCSADWSVKIWDHLCPAAVMTFDLQNAVGDIAWSPFSSTTFAAVTANGKALVFDLSVNKHEQLCEQKVVKRARLTHVTFAPRDPLLLVGDSHGWVTSLKLSPNLRKVTEIVVPEPPKKGMPAPEPPTREEVEVEKLNKVMLSADVKAAVPITQWDGYPKASDKVAAGEGGGAADAAAPE